MIERIKRMKISSIQGGNHNLTLTVFALFIYMYRDCEKCKCLVFQDTIEREHVWAIGEPRDKLRGSEPAWRKMIMDKDVAWDASSVWNSCTRFSDVIFQWRRREMSSVFSGQIWAVTMSLCEWYQATDFLTTQSFKEQQYVFSPVKGM